MPTIASIQGVTNTTVLDYFKTLSNGEFQATSNLFAIDGILYPPFENPIEGKQAIAAYLETEAKGITLHPNQGSVQVVQHGQTQVEVLGKVEMPLFGVNVRWLMILNAQNRITSVTIQLLASPQELMQLQR